MRGAGQFLRFWHRVALGHILILRSVIRYLAERSHIDKRLLELLLREKFLPVLVLSLELFVLGLDCGFLLRQLRDLILKDLHFVSLLHSASHCTFPVLKTFSGLLINEWIIFKFVDSTPVLDGLLEVLLLFLGKATDAGWVTAGVVPFV